jgi:hypothetical protein
MDFAGDVFHNPEVDMPTDLPFFNQADLGHPELDEDKWHALENRVFDLLGSGQPPDNLGRGQKLRATADQRAALAGALPENLLTRRRDRAVLRRASPSLAPALCPPRNSDRNSGRRGGMTGPAVLG